LPEPRRLLRRDLTDQGLHGFLVVLLAAALRDEPLHLASAYYDHDQTGADANLHMRANPRRPQQALALKADAADRSLAAREVKSSFNGGAFLSATAMLPA
jgi:hypothetical protein